MASRTIYVGIEFKNQSMQGQKKNRFHEVKIEYLVEKAKLFAPWCATPDKIFDLFKGCEGGFWAQYACVKRKISLSKKAPGYDVVDMTVVVQEGNPCEITAIEEVAGLGEILEKAFAVAAVFESGVQFVNGLVCKDRDLLEKILTKSLKRGYKASFGKVQKLRIVIDPKGRKKSFKEESTRSKIKAFSDRMQWIEQTFEFKKTSSIPLERVKDLYMSKFGSRPKKKFNKYLWDIFLEFELYNQTGVLVAPMKVLEGNTTVVSFVGLREKNGS